MRADSDVDLLVDFLPGARPGLLGVSAMMLELTTLLGRHVDLANQACAEATHSGRSAGGSRADL
jgi:predicted nucleotidyltransferase